MRRKRAIASVLCVLLLLSAMPLSASAAGAQAFSDLPENNRRTTWRLRAIYT